MVEKHYYTNSFAEGMIIPEMIGIPDGCIFDAYNGGSIFVDHLYRPSLYELKQYREGRKEIRLTCIRNVLWITFRTGNHGWIEGPFSPHLAKQASFPEAADAVCDTLEIALVDTADGRVLYRDKLIYNEIFRAALKTAILFAWDQPFNVAEYDALLSMVQNRYSVEQIAESATARCFL